MLRAPRLTFWLCMGGLAMVAALLIAPLQYGTCGHRVSWVARHLQGVGPPLGHNCAAGVLVEQLRLIARYRLHHLQKMTGEPDMKGLFSELNRPLSHTFTFNLLSWKPDFKSSGTGKDWQCRVDRTPQLPGNYLVTHDGTVYFDEQHPPTTEDRVLYEKVGD